MLAAYFGQGRRVKLTGSALNNSSGGLGVSLRVGVGEGSGGQEGEDGKGELHCEY